MAHRTRDLAEHLPLTEAVFEVLLALTEGERHGYAILKAVAERTDGRLTLHPGTLYRALNRMLEQGLIEEIDERPDSQSNDERRRYYRITRLGRGVATAEARRLADQVAAARSRNLMSDTERV